MNWYVDMGDHLEKVGSLEEGGRICQSRKDCYAVLQADRDEDWIAMEDF